MGLSSMEVIDAYPTGQQNSVGSIGVTCNCGHFQWLQYIYIIPAVTITIMMNNFKLLTLVQCTFIYRPNNYIDYQTKINKKSLHTLPVVPAMIYTNADLHKESVIKDNKGKAGIYRCASP